VTTDCVRNFDRTFTELRDFDGIENAMSALHRNADRTQTAQKILRLRR
jgi:hypothetical protein